MLDEIRRKLVVKRCRNRRNKYPWASGKWTALVLMDEDNDDVWVIDGRIDCNGNFQEHFASNQLFNTKEEAEIALVKYQLS